MPSNWTTMYEVQLQYRNAAFAHVALVLHEEYGENWFEEQVRGIFTAAEWDSLEANVSERYATAGLSIRVPPPFEWLGVSHLGGMIEKHGRYLIAGARSLQPQPRGRRVQSVARLCHQFRAVRDPVAHPPSEELSLRDLAFYTQVAQRVLQELGLDDDVDRLEEVLLDAGKPPSLPVVTELPAKSTIVKGFVGREAERVLLREWFATDDEPIRIVAGGGGTGKSALAYQAAFDQSQLPVTRLNFILWMSGKQRQLMGGKTVPIDADIYDDADVMSRLWAFFGGQGEIDRSTVLEFLRDTPGLIVADDVDSLSGEGGARARALLTKEIPYRTNTRVLATSRRELFGLETVTTSLVGFSEAETGEFLRNQIADQGLNVAFSSQQIGAIRQTTDGIPLYIVDLLRFIRTFDFDRALRQWSETGGGDGARSYALQREFEEISADAKRVLLAASRMGQSVSALDLSQILRLDDAAILAAIGELQNLFFVSKPSFIEGVPRFTVPSTTALLVNDVMVGTYEYDQICKAVDYYRDQASVSGYERGQIAEVHRTVRLLVERGEQDEADSLLERALKELPANPDLLGSRGYLYKRWAPLRLVDADASFRQAADLNSKNPFVYWEWADLHMRQKDYAKAAEAAERGIDACGEIPQLFRIAGAARRDLGNRLAKSLTTGRAMEEYRQARKHFRRMEDSNEVADARYQVRARDCFLLTIGLLFSMSKVDNGEDYLGEIRRIASQWQEAEPSSDEPKRWLS